MTPDILLPPQYVPVGPVQQGFECVAGQLIRPDINGGDCQGPDGTYVCGVGGALRGVCVGGSVVQVADNTLGSGVGCSEGKLVPI